MVHSVASIPLGRSILRCLALALICGSVGPASTAAQGERYTIQPGDALSTLAETRYGNPLWWAAILLATNDRAGDPGIAYIADPNLVRPGQVVIVPSRSTSDSLVAVYEQYERAVADMVLPQPWETRELIAVADPAAHTYVSWSRFGQLSEGGQRAPGDIWVTLAPYLRDFCQALPESTDLVLRLEQRLGLPPSSGKEVFYEMTVPDDSGIFRPCSDPSMNTRSCAPDTPDTTRYSGAYVDWFLAQYRSSYGTARPVQYPWTSLGYTFDWGGDTEVGENEFVIPRGDSITVSAAIPTEAYCRPAR